MREISATNFRQFLIAPALAHEVQVVGDVAGTWHVEPSHNPKSGEPAQIWVALTKQGGQIVPLSAATCQMNIYRQPQNAADAPIASPNLKAINIENYQGVPSAEVVFPQVGIYQVELNCAPRNTADFLPFQMRYNITVAAGSLPPPTPVPIPKPLTPVSSSSSPTFPSHILAVGLGGIFILGLVLALITFRMR